MNLLKIEKRRSVVAALMDGASINATVRMTGVSKPTTLKLLKDLGCACAEYHNQHVRGLKPERVECDEIRSFVFAKSKNVPHMKNEVKGAGDCWTWTAIDPDTKLMISYLIGLRTPEDAQTFMYDLSTRITNITQLTKDGLTSYPATVYAAFGDQVDYATLVKQYKNERGESSEVRYSPAQCIGCKKQSIIGFPRHSMVSTSTVERSNLTIRMSNRRFTRLTNGHSKKVENHGHTIALFFMYYNYCRIHQTLRVTPALQAGISDHVWSIEELIGLME